MSILKPISYFICHQTILSITMMSLAAALFCIIFRASRNGLKQLKWSSSASTSHRVNCYSICKYKSRQSRKMCDSPKLWLCSPIRVKSQTFLNSGRQFCIHSKYWQSHRTILLPLYLQGLMGIQLLIAFHCLQPGFIPTIVCRIEAEFATKKYCVN